MLQPMLAPFNHTFLTDMFIDAHCIFGCKWVT